MWGLVRVISIEHPELNSLIVDLEQSDVENNAPAQTSQLLSFLFAQDLKENQIAIRQARLFC